MRSDDDIVAALNRISFAISMFAIGMAINTFALVMAIHGIKL